MKHILRQAVHVHHSTVTLGSPQSPTTQPQDIHFNVIFKEFPISSKSSPLNSCSPHPLHLIFCKSFDHTDACTRRSFLCWINRWMFFSGQVRVLNFYLGLFPDQTLGLSFGQSFTFWMPTSIKKIDFWLFKTVKILHKIINRYMGFRLLDYLLCTRDE